MTPAWVVILASGGCIGILSSLLLYALLSPAVFWMVAVLDGLAVFGLLLILVVGVVLRDGW